MNEIYSLNKEKYLKNLKVICKLFCHRIPERTFKIRGKYFPVCARCTGLYLGVFLFFIYAYYSYVYYSLELTLFAFLMVVPTFFDGFTQLLGLRESNNTLRFVTGLFGGIGLLIIVVSIRLYLFS